MTDFVTGDNSVLSTTITDNVTGAAIDLSGASVIFRWKDNDGTLVEVVPTVDDAPNGVVSYRFLAGELIAPTMSIEVEVTDASSHVMTGLSLIELTVREQLG